jgi:hypothetical protein
MLDIRVWHDDVDSVPNFIFAIPSTRAALREKAFFDSRIGN